MESQIQKKDTPCCLRVPSGMPERPALWRTDLFFAKCLENAAYDVYLVV